MPKTTNLVPKDETQDPVTESFRDVVQLLRVTATAFRRTFPSPVADDLVQVVERRCRLIEERLGLGG